MLVDFSGQLKVLFNFFQAQFHLCSGNSNALLFPALS